MREFTIGDLKVKIPIIQGGMGVAISLSGLAAAVANEGGIGIISAAGIGMREPDYTKNFLEANRRALIMEIRKARQQSEGIIGVNVMLALTDHEELIKAAVSEKIDLVIMGAGLPLKIPAVIEESGLKNNHTKFAIKVSSAKAANLIFKYWSQKYDLIPDAVVVEGPLAGGHLGFRKEDLIDNLIPLHVLVEQTLDVIKPFADKYGYDIPVIAAGGIYTGKDMYEIMRAGATAVKIGTRFVTTFECDASEKFKDSYLNCSKEDLQIISSPVGLPGRVIRNEFVDQIRQGNKKPFKCVWNCLSTCNFRTAPYCIAQVLCNAADGRLNEGFAFAGANAYRAKEIVHVADIFRELLSEYQIASHRDDIRLAKMKLIKIA